MPVGVSLGVPDVRHAFNRRRALSFCGMKTVHIHDCDWSLSDSCLKLRNVLPSHNEVWVPAIVNPLRNPKKGAAVLCFQRLAPATRHPPSSRQYATHHAVKSQQTVCSMPAQRVWAIGFSSCRRGTWGRWSATPPPAPYPLQIAAVEDRSLKFLSPQWPFTPLLSKLAKGGRRYLSPGPGHLQRVGYQWRLEACLKRWRE